MVAQLRHGGWRAASRWLSLATILAMLAACAGKPEPVEPRNAFDTPQSQYNIGTVAFEDGRYEDARQAYRRATQLDREFVPAWKGLVRTALALEAYGDAREYLKQGRDVAQDRADDVAFAALELDLLRTEAADRWERRADSLYKDYRGRANRLEAAPEAAAFHLAGAEAYLAAGEREAAREAAQAVLALDLSGPDSAGATEIMQQINRVDRVALLGNEEITRIATQDQINRRDLVLLLTELVDLPTLLAPEVGARRSNDETAPDGGSDYAAEPMAEQIRDIHRLGLRFPKILGGRFYPDKTVSRLEFALMLEDVTAIVEEDRGLRSRYLSAPSPFSDLSSTHVGFNAMMTAINRGLYSAARDGRVRPNEPVSGPTAVEALRKLGLDYGG